MRILIIYIQSFNLNVMQQPSENNNITFQNTLHLNSNSPFLPFQFIFKPEDKIILLQGYYKFQKIISQIVMLPANKFPSSPSNISTGQQVYRHRSPEPAIYYQQKKQIKPEVHYLSQPSGILQGTPSLSFGLSPDSTLKANVNAVQARTVNNEGRYRGQVNKDKQPHGYGIYQYVKQKFEYAGNFQNGKPHGRGFLFTTNEYGNKVKVYEGEWKNGLKNGFGKYYYGQINHFYEGPWVDDIRHGKNGTYVSPSVRYVGEWVKGKMTGRGQMHFNKNGTKYIGDFKDNQFVMGKIVYPNGDTYEGKVLNGLRHDSKGTYTYANSGDRINFVGNWQKDLKHDNETTNDQKDKLTKQLTKGTITYSNGETLTGSFDHNKFQFGEPCIYKWIDGDILNGWLKQNSTGYFITGTIKSIDGKQYQVR